MKCRMLVVLLAGPVLFQLGCGGDDGGGGSIPACSGTFKACGGDLTGKWSIDGMCMEGDFKSLMSSALDTGDLPPQCSDLFQDVSVKMSGTIEYADGNQTSDVSTTISMKVKYTSACLSAMNGTSMKMTKAVCDALESSMNSQIPDDNEMTLSCSFSESCNCTMTMSGQSQETEGYTVSGGTMTSEDGETAEYCVSGKNLTVRTQSDDGPAGQIKLHKI